ncbi:MAG: hypothetical protein JWM35_1176, partial [Verrucomicrobia bacterium]|nr:hypothetical protein [Verrucomicrobiota bacterium]
MLLIIGYIGAAFFYFMSYLLILPMSAPLGSTIMTCLIAVGWQLIDEQKAK